jgi:hypothetical protein
MAQLLDEMDAFALQRVRNTDRLDFSAMVPFQL